MVEKYLTLEQNTCAARIFLNTFGLTLEDVSNINEFSKIKIFDKNMNEVGKLYFNNGKVIISANYNNYTLEANYDIAKVLGLVDIESENAIFGNWSSQITFKIQNKDTIKLDGEFLISNSIDSEFGNHCNCHPLINCEIPGKGNINLKILRDGKTFELEIISENYYEIIKIMPFDYLNGFIVHDIKKGKYDKKNHTYPYRKYTGIINGPEKEKKLRLFLKEKEYNKQLDFHSELISKINNDTSKDAVLQKGLLMKKLDPSMFETINKIRKLLLIDDISLLDNLISICYDNYTNEELNALLGIKREKMNYQDGADSLTKSYYGTDKNSFFLPPENQKRLLKK